MSATIVSDPMVVSTPETTQPPTVSSSSSTNLKTQIEVKFVKCELTEECTHAYIERICKQYQGKWICGLCAEAIKDEIIRTESCFPTRVLLEIKFVVVVRGLKVVTCILLQQQRIISLLHNRCGDQCRTTLPQMLAYNPQPFRYACLTPSLPPHQYQFNAATTPKLQQN
ncbi:hypothetical protein QYF36_003888 [Acer negundo]|nr:hypothetical protein QYF36_003888 [Acer negundo]